jgi:DNA-binding PadR family transcriptional regulator
MSQVPEAADRTTWNDLSAFQRDLLRLIDRLEEPYGLELCEELGRAYGEDINHSRLYMNLNDMEECGVVNKGSHDNRTNAYSLTVAGELALRERDDLLRDPPARDDSALVRTPGEPVTREEMARKYDEPPHEARNRIQRSVAEIRPNSFLD